MIVRSTAYHGFNEVLDLGQIVLMSLTSLL